MREPGSSEAGNRRDAITDLRDHRDREMLASIAEGDHDALSALMQTYGGTAQGLARRVLGDGPYVEEVLQEVFVSIWRRAHTYDPSRGTVRAWVMSQVHNRAVDVVRREEAERRRAARFALPEPVDAIDDVIEDGWLAARAGQVRAALQSLTADQRRVLELAYYRGLTQTQIADEIDAPLGTVKSRTLAALRGLRERLKEDATG